MALIIAQADASKAAKETAGAAKSAAEDAAQAAKDAAQAAKDAAAAADETPNITIDSHGIRVEDGPGGKKRKRVVVGIGGTDREYDSFEQFVHEDTPARLDGFRHCIYRVFLTPVLIIALVIWYKLRKNRMLNETMMKLAEKGVVPPAEALQALNAGQDSAAADAMAARAPLVEQAKALRTHAAWSDLRKGVILGAVGLGLTFFSMIDDGTPNSVGLVLLFLGIGYAVLWYFEDRQLAAPSNASAASAGGRRVRYTPMPHPTIAAPGCRLPRSPMHNSSHAHWLADDRHAFAELVRRHQSTVRACLRKLTAGNHALADDLPRRRSCSHGAT